MSKFRSVFFFHTFRGKQNYRTGPNPCGMGIRRSTKVRYFPNPRGIGIRRSTKVRYFTVLLYSWLRSIILALTVLRSSLPCSSLRCSTFLYILHSSMLLLDARNTEVTPLFEEIRICSARAACQAVATFLASLKKNRASQVFRNCLACLAALRQALVSWLWMQYLFYLWRLHFPKFSPSTTRITLWLQSVLAEALGMLYMRLTGTYQVVYLQLLRDCRTIGDHIVQHSLCRC